MKIEIKDSGGNVWAVTINGQRHTVNVWRGRGCYGAARGSTGGSVEAPSLREAVAVALSPHILPGHVGSYDSTAVIRRAVHDLTRCLEIRAAMRNVRLPKLRGVAP